MNRKNILLALAAVAGSLAAGAAQARDPEIRWSVTIGTPGAVVYGAPAVVPVYGPPVVAPVYGPPVVVRPAPPPRVVYYAPAAGWDRDRDGIPDRYDRRYDPRWDVDGDGIPNRHDRVYNPRWDRDGDGIPNRRDPYPDHPQRRGWGR